MLVLGILILLDVRPLQYLPKPRQLLQAGGKLWRKLQARRRVSLKGKVYRILGKKKYNVFTRTMREALQTLEKTGERSKAKRMERSCFAFSAAGVFAGLLLQNIYLAFALGVALYFVPLWIIKLSLNGYINHVNDELEVALSQITSAYESSSNIIVAVKSSLQYLNPPVHEAFERFVSTYENIDPDISKGIVTLRDSFDSYIFKEWCNALLQCQRDSTLKATLQPHVSKFSRQKYMQEKQQTGQMIPIREFGGLCIGVPVFVMLMGSAQKELLTGLISHPAGQIVIAITILLMVAGFNRAVSMTKPFEFRR